MIDYLKKNHLVLIVIILLGINANVTSHIAEYQKLIYYKLKVIDKP